MYAGFDQTELMHSDVTREKIPEGYDQPVFRGETRAARKLLALSRWGDQYDA